MSEIAIPRKLQGWAERAASDVMTRAAAHSAGEIEADVASSLEAAIKLGIATERESTAAPVPMRIHCPVCHALHVDEGEFATKPHKTHTCQGCGLNFQPALVPTVGVRFLPGCQSK